MHTATLSRVAAVIAIVSPVSYALPDLDNTTLVAIQAFHPEGTIREAATGDLNGDGVSDVAYLSCWTDARMECVLGVLTGRRGGTYVQLEVSQRFWTNQRFPEIWIKGRSLYVSLFRKSLSEAWSMEAQLQYRKGRMIVIGREQRAWSPVHDDEPGTKTEDRISTNLLTGLQVRTKTVGRKTVTERSKVEPSETDTLTKFGL